MKRFERSPFIVVSHDKRDFTDRLASLFLVLSDGGQPVPTFAVPPASSTSLLPASASPYAPTVQPAPPIRQSFILQLLAPGSSRKRPAENSIEPVGSKRLPSTSRGSVPT